MQQENKNQIKNPIPRKNSLFPKSSFSKKSPGRQNKLVSLLKLVICVFFLPVAVGNTDAFLNILYKLDKIWVKFFWSGIFSFFVIDLVIYKLNAVYKKGQRIVGIIFRFFTPLVKFAPYVLPIYTILILAFSVIISFFGDISSYQKALVFLAAFSIILHLVYTAGSMHLREADFLRAGYFFAILVIYWLNLLILAFTLDRILPDFSFLVFFRNACSSTRDIYSVIFKQFFLVQ